MSKEKSKEKRKPKVDRKTVKFPGLKHSVNSKTRQHLIDHDYIDKLNDEEKAWLSKFNEEYISGTFEKDENDEYTDNNFHKTFEERKSCWDRNNARNRCQYTRAQAIGNVSDDSADETPVGNIEDVLIEVIDYRKKRKKS